MFSAALDAPLVESLIGEHEQLATAARRFPNGMESVMEEMQRRRPSASGDSCGGFGMVGSPQDFPYMKTLLQASQDGDFHPSIEHALEQYRKDASPDNPNQVPRECLAFHCRFRGILYRAGKRWGETRQSISIAFPTTIYASLLKSNSRPRPRRIARIAGDPTRVPPRINRPAL